MNDTIEDIYELSPLQQGMLFHSIYEPDSRAYFEQTNAPFYGDLHLRAFTLAWEQVANRHAVLRTSFHWEHIDKPVQVVHRRVKVPIDWQDWSNLSRLGQARRLAAYLHKDRDTGFDISQPPLMRVGVIRSSQDEFRIIWSFHHILLDGWSYQLLENDFWTLYEGLCEGRTPSLDAVRHYGDYIAWLQSQDLAQAEAFWRRSLKGFTVPTTFASVYREVGPRPEAGEAEHATFELRLSRKSSCALQSLVRRHRLTMNTLIQGTWAILLSRYCGEGDVLFGTVVSGRPANLPGVESMVGLFINTLPMRTPVPAGEFLVPWLKCLQNLHLEARQYEYSPMVEIQRWSDLASRVALFDSIVVFENFPSTSSEGMADAEGGEEAATEGFESVDDLSEPILPEGTNYPLCLIAIPGSQLIIRFHYLQRVLSSSIIEQIATHLRTLLEGIAVSADRRLSELPLLTEEEETKLLVTWNASAKPYPQEGGIPELFEAQASATPDATAFICNVARLSFRELNFRANRLAHYLRELGVKPELLVGICLERSLDFTVALMAVLKAGGAYLPLDPSYPPDRLAFMLEDSGASVVISERRFAHMISAPGVNRVWIDDNLQEIARQRDMNPDPVATPEHLAYVIYTSGSTGRPKGVSVGHAQILNRLHWMWDAYPFATNEVCCQRTSLNFVDSIWELLGPLLRGIPTIIVPDEILKDPHALLKTLGSANVTRIWVVPSLLELLIETCPDLRERLPRLNFWVSSGEALSARLLAKFSQIMPNSVLYNLYGTSEVWDATWYDPTDAPAENLMRVPIGRPISNVQAYILDSLRRPVPLGVSGELCIGGLGLARGYVNLPELTAEKFISDPFKREPQARLYRTGDIARYRLDGTIEILGRTDHQIKVRGIRVEPDEVEAAANQFPDVRKVIVVAREQNDGDRRLVAYVTSNARTRTETDAAADAERVARWREIWDETYAQSPVRDDGKDDFAGWVSSFTGAPIPEDELSEHVERLANCVLDLQPSSILDIGCGTGLLASRIAQQVSRYCATDLSSEALHRLENRLAVTADATVHMVHCSAADFTDFQPESFDTIVLNSVVQYFPNIDHLLRVIECALRVLKAKGNIFIGDVRNLLLLEAFHASVELHRASPSLSLAELRYRVQRRVVEDDQLAIDPAFFASLGQRFPRINRVQIQPRQGRYRNEFTRFRYDVTLCTDDDGTDSEHLWHDWTRDRLTESLIRELLLKQPASFGIRRVPSADFAIEKQVCALLAQSEAATAGELRNALRASTINIGITSESLRVIQSEYPYQVNLNWSGPEAADCLDILFTRNDVVVERSFLRVPPMTPRAASDPSSQANDPLNSVSRGKLIRDLRDFLRQKLPEYMIPSAFTIVQSFPLTPNGKIDRAALPDLKFGYTMQDKPFVAPRTRTEEALTRIWQEVLAIEHLGIADNFFDLGGHSLTATRVLSRVRDFFQIDLPLRLIFDNPTVAALARCVDETKEGTNLRAMLPIRPLQRQAYAAVLDSAGRLEGTERSTRVP
jgi:amino acid adenylation domain-containing protein